jgi:ABC-type branched-subunit amino acid transport system substrate-binding protein
MPEGLTYRLLVASLFAVLCCHSAAAQSNGPGVTATEIKLGQTVPYSGPLSATSAQSKTEAAYYKKINSEGGIGGRAINMISLDDGYNPARTVEQTRRLVESDGVFAIIGSVGTPNILAIQPYMNAHKVPLLLVGSGDARFYDPQHFPWTLGFYPVIETEARVFARYVKSVNPQAKIGILYQNDDLGKAYVKGFKDELGSAASQMIVKELSYEVSDPTIDSQIVSLQASGADVFFDASTQRFAAQAIRKAYDINWKPLHIVISFATSIGAVMKPAGIDKASGVVSVLLYKQPFDPAAAADKGVQDYLAFLKTWYPEADPDDFFVQEGYNRAELTTLLLRKCGNDLTRENLLKQATSLKDVQLSMMLPGVTINTTPTNYVMFRSLQVGRFNGSQWVPLGSPITP